MKLVYDSSVIEQVYNALDGLIVSGILNNQRIMSISLLLQQNEKLDESNEEAPKDTINTL